MNEEFKLYKSRRQKMRVRVYPFLFVCFLVSSVAFCDLPPNYEPQGPTIDGYLLTEPDGTQWSIDVPIEEFEYEPEDGKYKLKGGFTQIVAGGTAELTIEEIEFDPDPTILYNFAWTNITGSVQNYTFNLTQPVAPLGVPNDRLGSITAGVIDAGSGDGATLATVAGLSMYNAEIDTNVVRTLVGDPTSAVAAPYDVNSINASFALETNNIAVNNTMGITVNFSLTPGDTASFLTRFDVIIPEPATIALLGLGAVILRKRR
jgi:hypothetical protein